jgi:branched-chain amino acid transport system substrate-binding protein
LAAPWVRETLIEGRGFKAGEYSVGYQLCDVSTPQTGGFEFRKCAANASAYARAEQLVAVIGPWSSFCAQVEIPILNRAPGGPPAVVSPSTSHPGLTRGEPLAQNSGLGRRGEPQVYYPTGVRNFARLVPREDLQGTANAMLAKDLGLKRVYVVHERFAFHKLVYAEPFRRAARRLGIAVAGSDAFNPEARSYDVLAARIARSDAQGVFLVGSVFEGADKVLKALRARLGARIPIMGIDQFIPIPELLSRAGPAARGVYVSGTDVPAGSREEGSVARRLAHELGTIDAPVAYQMSAAQATEVVLDAIARSDGTRPRCSRSCAPSRSRTGSWVISAWTATGTSRPSRSPSSA